VTGVRRSKRYEKAKNNPKTVRYEELVALVEEFGGEVREASHCVASFPNGSTVTIAKPKGKHVLPVYVRRVLDAIEDMQLEEGE
jgi:hypothetical protein